MHLGEYSFNKVVHDIAGRITVVSSAEGSIESFVWGGRHVLNALISKSLQDFKHTLEVTSLKKDIASSGEKIFDRKRIQIEKHVHRRRSNDQQEESLYLVSGGCGTRERDIPRTTGTLG